MVDTRLVILGAGAPFAGRSHSALRILDRTSRVLDWVLHAFDDLAPTVTFVAGYDADTVIARGPDTLTYVVNEHWRGTGSVGSLAAVPMIPGADLYISYADIVFGREVVAAMAAADPDGIAIAVDSASAALNDPSRLSEAAIKEKVALDGERVVAVGDRSLVDVPGKLAEFVGLMRVPARLMPAVQAVIAAQPELKKHHLSALVEALRARGTPIRVVDVAGQWCDLNVDRDLSRFVLGTKAETLARLRELVRCSVIDPQVTFRVSEWQDSRGACIASALSLPGECLAVRSSALTEDSFESANAGRYLSILDVPTTAADIEEAIDRVVASFDLDGLDHQVLVQPMVDEVAFAGVVLTRGLQTGAPYYRVSYSGTGDTTAITSGLADDATTWVVHRGSAESPDLPPEVKSTLASVLEIEDLLDFDALDVEFALTFSGQVHILQVRPLVLDHDRTAASDADVDAAIASGERLYRSTTPAGPRMASCGPIWSRMSDWNPAEIIGACPSRLALSLYRTLITGDVWARQRAEFGYRDLRPTPLVRLFSGHAFVDVRASLTSFVPAEIPAPDADRLVSQAADRLRQKPELHDKIEFEVIPTCLDFDFKRWGRRLDLSDDLLDVLGAGYRRITNGAFRRLAADEASVRLLPLPPDAGEATELDRLRDLLIAAREMGTLPFAHLARHAFIATSLLRSAARIGALSPPRHEEFLRSVRTVTADFLDDAWHVKTGRISRSAFIERYGHLRPGTYDVTCMTYRDHPELYVDPVIERATEPYPRTFVWMKDEAERFDSLLLEAGLELDAAGLDDYARRAIAARERAKFLFTRHVSAALDAVAAFGDAIGLSREEVAELSVPDLDDFGDGAVTAPVAEQHLRARAQSGVAWRRVATSVALPSVILSMTDFRRFRVLRDEPTFVTSSSVTARVVVVDDVVTGSDIDGAIALVLRADPGWDWVFGHEIAGLVTAFGGSNSHMAIRAAELGVPAAIGIGAELFDRLRSAHTIQIDGANRRIIRGG